MSGADLAEAGSPKPLSHVRTVLGDVPAAQLGVTNYHEHLFQVSPLLPADDLDDETKSTAEARLFAAAGTTAMVNATPTGLERRPAALARISAGTGLHIVATSGAHRDAHYGSRHWLTELSVEELTRRFTADVQDGMPLVDAADPVTRPDGTHNGTESSEIASIATTPTGGPVRAGLLKAGIDYWTITPFQRRVIEAIGIAHTATGAPVMIHLEHGSATFEVLALLADCGVPASAVALAHIDRNPDPGLHAELAAAGAYLGYDGVARTREWPDSMVLDCLLAAADRGAADRILLGGDVARRTRYVAYGGMPGLAYLAERFLPRLRAAGSAELVEQVLQRNPQRWLSRFEG